MFGVGAIFGPLIAKPFLVNFEDFQPRTEKTDRASNNVNLTDHSKDEDSFKLHWPYGIASMYTLLTVISFSIVYIKTRKSEILPTKLKETTLDQEKVNSKWRIVVVIVSTLFCHFYFALILVCGTFLMTFVVKCDLHLDKSTGAVMNSFFWITFTFFRLPSIWIMHKIGLEKSILVNLSLMILANLVLVPFGNSNIYALWIGIALIGKFTSAVYSQSN